MDIHESAVRVLEAPQIFGETFYDIFFQRTPQARVFFEGTDMERQHLVLTMAISVIEQFSTYGYPATEAYLKYLGTQHRKREIPRDLFPDWRDAMLEALEQSLGDDWSPELAAAWRTAFDRCLQVVFEGYDRDFTV